MTAAAVPVRLTRTEIRVAAVVALGGLLAVLDTTIVAVALPRFMSTFAAPLTSVQWIGTAYALGTVATMPLAAAAAQRWTARRVYLVALLAFAIASAAAGLAPGLGALIAARAVQGFAGGLIGPLGFMLGFGAARPERRARMTTITGLPLLVGPVLGPLFGGFLIDGLPWRWLFFVTAPPALLAVLGVLRWTRTDGEPGGTVRSGGSGREPVDVIGGLLLVPGVVAVAYGLSAAAYAPWVRGAVVATGALLVAAFAARSLRHPAPLLKVRLLADRTFGRGAAVLALYAAPYFGSTILLPAYVQVVRGDPATVSALLVIPGAVAMGLSVQIAARVLERAGGRAVVGTGLAMVIAASTVTAIVLRTDTPYALLAALGVVTGAGTGAIMMPTMAGAGRNLHGADLASGSSLLQLSSTVAGAIGIAGVSALFAWFTALAGDGRRLGNAAAGGVGVGGGGGIGGAAVTGYRLAVVATLAFMAAALIVRLRTVSAGAVGAAAAGTMPAGAVAVEGAAKVAGVSGTVGVAETTSMSGRAR